MLRVWSNSNSHILLLGVVDNTITLENKFPVVIKAEGANINPPTSFSVSLEANYIYIYTIYINWTIAWCTISETGTKIINIEK